MMSPRLTLRLLLLLFFFFFYELADAETEERSRTFVFLVDPKSKPSAFPSHLHWYSSLLPYSSRLLLHHYHSLLHGFSASLTPSEATSVGNSPGIVGFSPDSILRPHITRSPSFLGLDLPGSRLSALSRRGSAAVIGVVDTGIWPERPSFSDRGLGPPPRRWRGECEEGPGFNRSCCNRKLVGARSFSAGYAAAFGADGRGELPSARDHDGHGTHVASIAAGAPVAGAGFEGFALGVARGVAPRARIAAYKACWTAGCMVSDVVAAIEMAVSDGVDVLSLSIGSSSPAPSYHLDPLAVATFRATMRGVFVTASAGNGGPSPASVANSPPWITTVGAGTIDRDFPAVVRLGNGECVRGTSISIPPRKPTHRRPRRLFSAGKISVDANLTSEPINGRIVFWESSRHAARIEAGAAMKRAGAIATVVYHGDLDPEGIIAEPHVVPTVVVGSRGAAIIEAYIRNSRNPTAAIWSAGTQLHPDGGGAPEVASFSARGPNPAVPWVLKPDILAPGVNILGAWTGAIGPSGWGADIRRPGFSVMSGTSMACPHVSGVAALVRASRPGWGPGEIRSALVTTSASSPVGDEAGEGGPLAVGAGHLRPERAADPGLVYDLRHEDYVGLLCGLNYTDKSIRAITGREGIRCEALGGEGVWGFNYPGFVAVAEEAASRGEVVFHRRLKRVNGGGAGRWYKAEVAAPEGCTVVVAPERLWFGGRDGETLEFRLVLRWIAADGGRGYGNYMESSSSNGKRHWWRSGNLRWREEGGKHIVRSPIVVLDSKYI